MKSREKDWGSNGNFGLADVVDAAISSSTKSVGTLGMVEQGERYLTY